MKLKLLLLSWLGALLFLVGVLIGLSLSAAVAWGESEARIYSSYNGDLNLGLKCPLIMSPAESGVVSADIINLTDEEIKPVVTAEISHGKLPREIRQTLSLASTQSEMVQWTVDSSDVIFERAILVNVIQRRYGDNPSRSGSCGILVFDLFGLTGVQTFGLVFTLSLILMLSGGSLWLYARRPLDKFSGNIVQINSILLGITMLALLSTLARWWGLALFFDALILLVMGVIVTEFVLFSQKHRE
ncbi:MAG: hypothetical protein L0287_34375 [Anaerolineae bacterium]|nr:hypothetical protein [Anaerolineae bacterium]